jgi:two-component system, NarL family, nitrate/nitrite response regulator NarL
MNPIRLLLLHDHVLFRDSLSRQLASEPDFEVVAAFSDPSEGLQILKRSAVDVVVVDLNLGAGAGALNLISSAIRAGYRGKILVTASRADRENSLQALRLGVSGVFLVHDSLDNLLKAVRLVAGGNAWLNHGMIKVLTESGTQDREQRLFRASLTPREEQVLEGILEGLANKRIAERLDLTEGAVKTTVRQLFQKAGVRTRSQLVRAAINR